MVNIKLLALVVILKALEDLQYPRRGSKTRTEANEALYSAKEFCLVPDNWDLRFWCGLAEIDPALVVQGANRIIKGEADIDKIKKLLAVEPKAEDDED